MLKVTVTFVTFSTVWSKLLRAFLACVTAVASLHFSVTRKKSGRSLLWVSQIQGFSDFSGAPLPLWWKLHHPFIAADLKLWFICLKAFPGFTLFWSRNLLYFFFSSWCLLPCNTDAGPQSIGLHNAASDKGHKWSYLEINSNKNENEPKPSLYWAC